MVGGQTGKDWLLTWADGVKFADRRAKSNPQPGDRATENGLTTQVLLLKSLESNGDKRNYLSS